MADAARTEFILGGQKSGKSRRAETLARQWLQADAGHAAVLLATAEAWDDEMRQRIERHQRDRAERVPGMTTVETSLDLAAELTAHSQPHRLVVIDCPPLLGTPNAVALSALAQTIEGQDVDAIRKRSAEMKADAEALVDHVKDRGVRFREEAGAVQEGALVAPFLPLTLSGSA